MTEYRVRFTPRSTLSGSEPLTAKPGIIRRNKPKALAILARYQQAGGTTFWLESRATANDEWVAEQ